MQALLTIHMYDPLVEAYFTSLTPRFLLSGYFACLFVYHLGSYLLPIFEAVKAFLVANGLFADV